jgi:hypothetical protein
MVPEETPLSESRVFSRYGAGGLATSSPPTPTPEGPYPPPTLGATRSPVHGLFCQGCAGRYSTYDTHARNIIAYIPEDMHTQVVARLPWVGGRAYLGFSRSPVKTGKNR